MTKKRPDLLAGMNNAARLRREWEDAMLLRSAGNVAVSRRSALEVNAFTTFAGTKAFKPSDFKLHQEGDAVDFVVCARVDLDHPIYFNDNLFCDCADCGCDLQVRPHSPPGPRLCVCCAARRVREDPDFAP